MASSVTVVLKNGKRWNGRVGDGSTSFTVQFPELNNLVQEDMLVSAAALSTAQLKALHNKPKGDEQD